MPGTDTDREPRVRKLTLKAKAMFEEHSAKLRQESEQVWERIEDLMLALPTCNSVQGLRQLDKDINMNFKAFCQRSEVYKEYLSRTRTEESQKMLNDHSEFFNRCSGTMRKITSEIHMKKMDVIEQLSDVSKSTAGSSASHKRAKAEAEKVRLEFMKRESELLKLKAEIEANLNVMKQERRVAAVEKEASVREQGEQDIDLPSVAIDKHEHVQRYVQNLSVYEHQTANTTNLPAYQPDAFVMSQSAPLAFQPAPDPAPITSFPAGMSNQPFQHQPTLSCYRNSLPQQQQQGPPNMNPINTAMSDITKFMLRKDFLLTRFSHFDDNPESFASWRASFQSITQELDVSAFEEMDLLVKWLGPESSKFARSLRAANAHDLTAGVQRIWERLDARYGRPEMVEHSLKKKLNLFPNLTNKDNQKLYDLLDILTEIESALVNPLYTTLLSYFNSSSGVAPIVSKRPYALQEK